MNAEHSRVAQAGKAPYAVIAALALSALPLAALSAIADSMGRPSDPLAFEPAAPAQLQVPLEQLPGANDLGIGKPAAAATLAGAEALPPATIANQEPECCKPDAGKVAAERDVSLQAVRSVM